jgi:hypothetical protein
VSFCDRMYVCMYVCMYACNPLSLGIGGGDQSPTLTVAHRTVTVCVYESKQHLEFLDSVTAVTLTYSTV